MALPRLVPVAVFALLPIALGLPALRPGKMLYGADVVAVFHFARQTVSAALREGRLPTWDPGVMTGFPSLAAAQSAVFYPPTWLCLAFDAGTFWTVTALGHLALAGSFAFLWLRRGLGLGPWASLAGGVFFMASGFLSLRIYAGHVTFVWAFPWIAAILWRLERLLLRGGLRRAVLLGVAWAMPLLAGAPQIAFLSALALAARLVSERGRGAAVVLGAIAGGTLIAAPQLLPTIELAGESHRASVRDATFFASQAMPPENLATIVWPTVFGDAVSEPYRGRSFLWESCAYVGVATVLLAIAGVRGLHPQRGLWAAVGIAALVLAMVPLSATGLGVFRGPGRFLGLFATAAAALAAMGTERLGRRGALLAGMAAAELVFFGARYFRAQDKAALDWPPELARGLAERAGDPFRAASAGAAPVPSIGRCAAAGIEHVGGYDPLMLRRYAELVNAARGAPPETPIVLLASASPHPVLDLLGARYWFVYPGGDVDPSWPRLGRAGSAEIRENPESLPRAWRVSHAVVVESRDERLRGLTEGSIDPRRTVVLESMPSEAPPDAGARAGRARIVGRAPGEYRVEVEGEGDGYLVVSEAFYPGWEGWIDGRRAEVVPADHLLMAVRVPAGRHDVTLRYRSRFLPAGFALAGFATLVPAGIALRRRISSRRPSTTSAGAEASGGPSTGGS